MRAKQDMPLVLESQVIARTSLFDIEVSLLRFRNGVERRLERITRRAGCTVLIVPLLEADTLLLIREYCAGTRTYELAFPTGTVGADETIEEAANRELKEEVGFGAALFSGMMTLKVVPGHFDHETHVVLAESLYPEKLPGDEPEAIELVRWPVSAIAALLETGEFAEARSVTALLLFERLLHARRVVQRPLC